MEGESAEYEVSEYQYNFSRDAENIIGRIYAASPCEVGRYYLRTLLQHIPRATSFQDVGTYMRKVCPTYPETCLTRGLLSDDAKWKRALLSRLHFIL